MPLLPQVKRNPRYPGRPRLDDRKVLNGIPLAAITPGGNRNDVTQLLPLFGAIAPVRGLRGRPRQRPRRLYADRGYDHETYRDQVVIGRGRVSIRLR